MEMFSNLDFGGYLSTDGNVCVPQQKEKKKKNVSFFFLHQETFVMEDGVEISILLNEPGTAFRVVLIPRHPVMPVRVAGFMVSACVSPIGKYNQLTV